MRIVRVVWRDSAFHSGWRRHSEAQEFKKDPLHGVATCESTGFLVHADKAAVVLSMGRGLCEKDGDYEGFLSIPRSAVVNIVTLHEKTRAKARKNTNL